MCSGGRERECIADEQAHCSHHKERVMLKVLDDSHHRWRLRAPIVMLWRAGYASTKRSR
jgi:hypothetical protein